MHSHDARSYLPYLYALSTASYALSTASYALATPSWQSSPHSTASQTSVSTTAPHVASRISLMHNLTLTRCTISLSQAALSQCRGGTGPGLEYILIQGQKTWPQCTCPNRCEGLSQVSKPGASNHSINTWSRSSMPLLVIGGNFAVLSDKDKEMQRLVRVSLPEGGEEGA